jgi:hypothetical protein
LWYVLAVVVIYDIVLTFQVEIRSKLGEDDIGQIDGSAKEYLWNLECLPSEEDFVLGILFVFYL